MILQSPESAMPEPYTTYVRQRSQAIADTLVAVVGETNVQLCPKAITVDEQVFADDPEAIAYGAVVREERDGFKGVLYGALFLENQGVVTSDVDRAAAYASQEFTAGNRVRLKDVHESDGMGQRTVASEEELRKAFTAGQETVVMPHLESIDDRLSIGRIGLGVAGAFDYVGREFTVTHDGREVYGGTDIGLYRNTDAAAQAEALKVFEIDPDLQLLGSHYIERFRQISLEASRVSVDVLVGSTDNGTKVADVVDITPRVGGVTPAEVLAIRALHQNGGGLCLAAGRLLYNPSSTPKVGTNFVDTETLVINANIQEIRA